jgi:FkbM family methyltransferase
MGDILSGIRRIAGKLKLYLVNQLVVLKSRVTKQEIFFDSHQINWQISPNNALDQLVKSHHGFDNGLPFILKSYLQSNETAIDVGANAGYYAIPLSFIFESVYAFEPIPKIYKKLKKNIELNEIQNIVVYPEAVGAEDGKATFYYQESIDDDKNINIGLSSFSKRNNFKTKKFEVKVNQLDTLFVGQNIGLIKIDVEGHEFLVFQGARNLLARKKPVVVWEASMNISRDKDRKSVV